MKNKTKKKFDLVAFFSDIKQKMAEHMKDMSLEEKREFLRKVRERKIKLEK